MSNHHFINPYNFIPLGKEKAGVSADVKTYTGVISYSILTKTPLFIPNTSNDDAFHKNMTDHKSYDFFSYKNLSGIEDSSNAYYEPMIPGSEIRGMLRSNYEALTNSCLSSLDTDSLLSKRTNEVFKAGILVHNGKDYDLYSATNYVWNIDFTREEVIALPDGKKVYFNDYKIGKEDRRKRDAAKDVSLADTGQKKSGYLMIGEGGVKKKHPHVFVKKSLEEEKIDIQSLGLILEEYDKDSYTGYRQSYQDFISGKEDKLPVYYSKMDGRYMLSPASITREIYDKKLKDIVKTFTPCHSLTSLCPACALFGMLNGESKASKIRFSDLSLTDCFKKMPWKDLYLDMVTIPELSSPKLNNMEFYVKRPSEDAVFWTYDYYVDINGKIHFMTPEINGRKFYWHKLIKDQEVKSLETKINNRNSTIRPLKSDVTFSGKLYFKNLTKMELDQLIWLLNIGEETNIKDRTHGYKMGLAKPLGFGSIAIKTEEITCRVLHVEEEGISINDEPYSEYESPVFDDQILKNYLKMTNFKAVEGKKVHYPYPSGNESAEGFKWFVENHKKYDRGSMCSKMPNSRTQMGYETYMKPMETFLSFTIENKGKDETPHDISYHKGQEIQCVVKKIMPNRAFFFAQANGIDVKVFEGNQNLKKGNKIKVKLTKVNDDMMFGSFVDIIYEERNL